MRNGDLPVSSEASVVEHVEDVLRTPMSRNEVTAAMAVAGLTIAGAVYGGVSVVASVVAEKAGRSDIDQREEELVEVDVNGEFWTPQDLPVRDEERWIAFGGTGRPDSISSAREVLGFLRPEARVRRAAGIIYSPRGISIEKIGQLIGNFTTDVGHRRIKVLAESKGGQEALSALASMPDPPFVELFAGVGCPFGIDDLPPQLRRVVQLAIDSEMLSDDQQAFFVNLGDEIRAEFEFAQNRATTRRDLLRRGLGLTLRSVVKTWEGNGRLYLDGAKIVGKTETAKALRTLAEKGAITPETRFVYLGSLPGMDGTVMVDSASRSYESALQEIGAWFLSLPFNGGHAEVPAALQEYRRYIESADAA